MPTYEYECKKCGVVEVQQKITDEPHKICPNCKKEPCTKIISLTSFELKGKGWYATDYKKKT